MRFRETLDRRGSNICQSKMKSITNVLLCLVALVGSAYGLSCPCDLDIYFTCTDEPTEESCPYGRVNDACDCCLECARGPGEDCGGPWGVVGTCAAGFTCVKVPGGYEDSVGFEGRCQEATSEETANSTPSSSSTNHSPSSTTHSHTSTTHSPSSTTPSE